MHAMCVVCVCDVYVWGVLPWGSMSLLSFTVDIHIPDSHDRSLRTDCYISIQTRTVNKQEDLAPEGGLLSDVDLHERLPQTV